MRGTNPSLTQTLINGHTVAAGDWFVLNQVAQVGRSVSYTLLPSELVDQVVVHKSSAGLARRGRRRRLGRHHDAQAARFQRPDDVRRLARWRLRRPAGQDRPAVQRLVQLEERRQHDRRAGAGVLRGAAPAPRRRRSCSATSTIEAGSAIATTNPDLAGVHVSGLDRRGLVRTEARAHGRPASTSSSDAERRSQRSTLQYFMSNLDATNYNRNYLLWATHFIDAARARRPLRATWSRTARSRRPVSRRFPARSTACTTRSRAPTRRRARTTSASKRAMHVSDAWTFVGKLGTSTGHGKTPTQDVSETRRPAGTGAG